MNSLTGTDRKGSMERVGRCRKALVALALGLLMGVIPVKGLTDQKMVSEYQVKAAFLYNFGQFVQWPEEAGDEPEDEFGVCVYGEDPFGGAMASLRGKSLGEKMLQVRMLEDPSDPLEGCHILFIKTDRINTGRVLERISGMPILTVGDEEGFSRAGGIIELFTSNRKVRFTINQQAAAEAGLTISSKLLRLSVPVEERRR